MLFSINRTPDAFHSVKNQASNPLGILGGGYEDIPLLEPHPGTGTIDVVNKFAWTKTRSIEEQHQKVPTLYLEEMYVTAPDFVSNFKRAVETLKNISQGIEGTIPQNIIQLITAVPEQLLNSVNSPNTPYKDPRSIREYIDSMGAFDTLDVGEEKYKYMNPYKSFYGVKDTRFRYRLPYFTDTLKKVSNNFDKGAFESFKDRLVGKLPENLGGLFSSGFGIDFAKMYNYKDDGPETTITFYLDNTYDSFTGSWKSPNSYQQNWEFIFLLLYQNLPAKVNTLLVQPPVIYSARVPGVFRYLYSYISSLNVECMVIDMKRK